MAQKKIETFRGTEVQDEHGLWLWPHRENCRMCGRRVETEGGCLVAHRGARLLCSGSGAFVGRRVDAINVA